MQRLTSLNFRHIAKLNCATDFCGDLDQLVSDFMSIIFVETADWADSTDAECGANAADGHGRRYAADADVNFLVAICETLLADHVKLFQQRAT